MGAARSGGKCAAPDQMKTMMLRAIYVAAGFWLARTLFRRSSFTVDLARLRKAGL